MIDTRTAASGQRMAQTDPRADRRPNGRIAPVPRTVAPLAPTRQNRRSKDTLSDQPNHIAGVTSMARKPNYDFERREREKNKAEEAARKAQAKADRKAAAQATPEGDQQEDA